MSIHSFYPVESCDRSRVGYQGFSTFQTLTRSNSDHSKCVISPHPPTLPSPDFQIWWRSRLASWLQVAVLGLSGNEAQPEIFKSQDTHSTQTQIVIECSITQQPLHRLTPFLFVDVSLVRARPWLCSESQTTPSSPRYSSHKVP